MDNAVDQATGTIKVKGSFPNKDQRLWPGAFVNVVLTLVTDPDAIVVPTTAVQSGQTGRACVFVVEERDRPPNCGRSTIRAHVRQREHHRGRIGR